MWGQFFRRRRVRYYAAVTSNHPATPTNSTASRTRITSPRSWHPSPDVQPARSEFRPSRRCSVGPVGAETFFTPPPSGSRPPRPTHRSPGPMTGFDRIHSTRLVPSQPPGYTAAGLPGRRSDTMKRWLADLLLIGIAGCGVTPIPLPR